MKMIISMSESNEAQHRESLKRTGFWGKRAAGCLFVAQDTGRLLISHRSPHVQEPNTWGPWGGALDEGETPLQGVRREMREEAGYTGKVQFIAMSIFSHHSGFKYFNYLAIVPKEFEPEMDWETQGFKWVEYGHWPSPLHPGFTEMLKLPENKELLKHWSDKGKGS